MSITAGYGERGLGILGGDSAVTSDLGTEFTCGAASTFASGVVSGAASAFCTVVSLEAGSGLAWTGAGRALLLAVDGKSAFPICWVSSEYECRIRLHKQRKAF